VKSVTLQTPHTSCASPGFTSSEMTSWNKRAFTGNKNFNQKPILKSVWKIHAAYSFFKMIKRKNNINKKCEVK
jgi:hypothetical protein